MAEYCHVSTGSNMKKKMDYRGICPHTPKLLRSLCVGLCTLWLALAPLALNASVVNITCPPTITIACNTAPTPANTGNATASTSCGSSSAVNITYTDNMSQLNGCMGTGTILRTWTATDQCGASASCIQAILVEDNQSPTLTCPPFRIISCNSDTSAAALGMAQATDNCTPVNQIMITYVDHADNLTGCNGTGTFTRHWTAEDMCGNVAACIQTIVIQDNQKPVMNLPPAITISCEESSGVENTGYCEAFDNCTPVADLTIQFSDNVFGLNGCNGTGTIVRTWSARDACNNITTGIQFITVVDTEAPSISTPANITISCENSTLPATTGTMTATDQCGTSFTGYTDLVLQQACNGPGVIQRTWSAIDNCGNISQGIQIITIIDVTVPVVTCPANITVDCAQGVLPAVTGSPVTTDNCTAAANLVVNYNDVPVSPLGCNGTGTLRRTWSVTDACGNTTTCTQMIHVTDLLKPTLNVPPATTISCESSVLPAVTGNATANDNCTPAAQITITYTDDVSGLFGCNGTGIMRRTWSASDLCGNVTTGIQNIFIADNTDPNMTCPPDMTISCSSSAEPSNTGSATATDNCTADVEITYSDNLQLTGCNNTGLILRNWMARDECGNVKTCMQLITVIDTTAPIVICPRDTIIDCGFYNNPDALGYPTGYDNCSLSDDIELAYDDDLSGLTGCTNTGVILRTWYMTDACGNVGSCVQRITVADTTEPTIICPPNTVITCQDATTPSFTGRATATDYCTASLFIDIAYTDDLSEAGQCNGSGFIYRTWSATDDCGNVATCVQTIEIIDNVAPEIQCPASWQIQCDADRSPAAQGRARATDNCTPQDNIIITYQDDISNLTGCNQTGNLYRTWTATDACGNTTTCVQVLTVIDTKAPVLTPPPFITVSCESSLEVAVTGDVTAVDNCTPAALLDIQISDDYTAVVGCNKTGTLKRTWVVSDACGNSSSTTQQIRIVDTTVPSITCAPSLQVHCGEPVDPSALGYPEISDNCTPVANMDLLHFDNTTGLNQCSGTGTLIRTWIVYDDCGNQNSCVQTIQVVDNTGPSITLPPNITISCEYADDLDALGRATAVDECSPSSAIVITFKDDNQGLFFCNSTGQRVRTWKAVDLCGNESTANQIINFIDTLAPIFYTPFDVQIDCDENPLDFNLVGEVEVFTDNCANLEDVVVTWHDELDAIEDCDGNPVINRVWTLTDPCGNARSSVQRIKIMNYSMNQVVFPDDITIPCEEDVMDLTLTGNVFMPLNACSYLVDTVYTEELGELEPYVYSRKWICIDYCGHVEEQMQTITLVDYHRPSITVHDMSISFAQSEEIAITVDDIVTEVTDNCDANVELALSQYLFTCNDFLTTDEQLLEITATDDQGNQTIEQVTVSLEGGLFLMTCPNDITVHLQNGECSAEVGYAIAPIGLCNQVPTIQQIDNSGLTAGGFFPIGTTVQTYLITDQLGYSMECAFTVEVVEFQGSNELACNDTLHVSVAFDCEAPITPDMILEGNHYGCYDQYVVSFDDASVVFENGVLDAHNHINQYLDVCISDPATGNYCCGVILLEDKLPPTLTCSDITLECTDDISPEAIPNFPVPPGTPVTPLGNNRYSVAGIDNCGLTVISYTDAHDLHMCDGIYSDIITRTWIGTDESGHSDTCTEQIYLLRGTIDQFVFPGDTTIYCGNECIRPDGTPDPNCIGGIEGPFCGTFFKGYIDKIIYYCGASYAVKREWTLVDWCTSEVIDHVQIINIEDNEAPIIECPAVIPTPATFGDCGAQITLPFPVAYDECGSDPLSYKLFVNGEEILMTNHEWLLPALGLGEHTVIWEVSDDCGNKSTCETTLELFDQTPPTAYCDAHIVIAINNQDPMGVALLPATSIDDGSFDNCGPVTFRARRMDSCIDFDWTSDGYGHQPDGDIDNYDLGLIYNEYVPVSCCDASEDYILVQLEVTDAYGNKNYCMVQVEVQDKQNPIVTCPPDIEVSCDFWFDPDVLEHPDNRTFGTIVNGFLYDESERQPIIINDPGNPNFVQPHNWGKDGYVLDNCDLEMEIRVTVLDDCSGDDLPGDAPDGAVKLITRRFIATDPAGRVGTCTQRIWVVNFDPFYINEENPNDPTDDVIWPPDVEYDNCAMPDTIYPIISNDGCAQIGINLKERRFDHTEGACVKILRDWTIIDWCQYNTQTGAGLWKYTQVVKITDDAGSHFLDCNSNIRKYCTTDPEVTPVTNQAFETSCYVHLNYNKKIEDICSEVVTYDVKIYPPNSSVGIVAVRPTDVHRNSDGTYDLVLNTANAFDFTLRLYGLAYNDPFKPNEHYKIIWSVVDGCGNLSTCEDRVRLEDCKQPTPVCINGLSTVPMPSNGSVVIWARDFDASSFDNCTPEHQLRFSFSGDTYQPSMIFTCADIIALGVQQPIDIWVWDNWGNKDFCSTTIVFTDPTGVCGLPSGGITGIVTTPGKNDAVSNVGITLMHGDQTYGSQLTGTNGVFEFPVVPANEMYTLVGIRDDDPKNGVSTLDLVALQKHLLGIQPLGDPYLLIAADANNSGTVSAIDMVEIRRVVLGLHSAFHVNNSWRIIPENYVFPDPYNPFPFMEQTTFMVDSTGAIENFLGVKVGDLNRSAAANATMILPRSSSDASLEVVDRFVKAGEEVEVVFSISDFDQRVLGGQWAINATDAVITGVQSNTVSMTEDMWHADQQSVRWSWTTQQPEEVDNLVRIRIVPSRSGMLSSMIDIDPTHMDPELYNEYEEIYNLHLEWRDEVHFADDIQLHQNRPNPWTDETIIPFEIPADGEVTLTLTNVLGEQVSHTTNVFAAGKQQFKISNTDWPAGAYYYTIQFGDTQLTKTMLILNKH
jgi:hypothetical protein